MKEQTGLTFSSIQDMLEKLESIQSVDEIIALVKKIDALKIALEAADTFRKQSIMYAKLEANALVRVAELDGIGKLRGYHRKTAEWLFGLSELEREKWILECENGLTIDQVYKNEIEAPLKFNAQFDRIKERKNDILDECREKGIVDIKPFIEDVKNVFRFDKAEIGEDIIDGMRNKLRKAGAYGIGGDSGIYVMAKPENSEEIKSAIRLRYDSIIRDLQSIKQIAKASGVKMSFRDFDNGSNFSYRNRRYIVNILLSFIDMGILSDSNDCIDAIDASWFHEEVSNIQKQFGISRKEYIKKQYEKYFGV